MLKNLIAVFTAAFGMTTMTMALVQGADDKKAVPEAPVPVPPPAAYTGSPAIIHAEDVERLERERYKGISVIPDPRAVGDSLKMQRDIAALLNKRDFVPSPRTERFRMFPERFGTKITGWYGHILETTPRSDGILIKLRVDMRHDATGGIHTFDHAIEYYLYANGQIRYLGSEEGPSRGVTTWN